MKSNIERRFPFVFIPILIVLVLLFTSCSGKLVETTIDSQSGVSGKILIAGDSSEFKDTIRNLVIKEFQSDYNIDIINIDALNKTASTDYSAILIMDTCMAWSRFNPSLKSFMEQAENKDKTVLFMTAGNPDWKYSYLGVDAITSASEIENETVVFERIKSEIKEILTQ